MYETEINDRKESSSQIPSAALAKFSETQKQIQARTLLPWGEHCTECAAPACYSSCDLYSPREDGKCRRFLDGMVRIDNPGTPQSYLLKVRFKRWGQFFALGNLRLYPRDLAQVIEKKDRAIGQFLYHIALPQSLKQIAIKGRYFQKRRRMHRPLPSQEMPDSFLLECFNPAEQAVALSFSIRPDVPKSTIAYQRLIRVEPGFNLFRIPVSEIAGFVDLRATFRVFIIPNEIADGATLFFGTMDFVREAKPHGNAESNGNAKATPLVKCVVWDLDHTLWNGILVEDGPEKLVLKPEIRETLEELDRRGILVSIASKNNQEEAEQVLHRFGIYDYFLHPQINWAPKSEGVRRIAEKLNIGIDTLLFIDDSEFERAQVASAVPAVRVMDAGEYTSLLMRPDCTPPLTANGASRRKMYQQESVRESAAASFAGDYMAFLRDSRICLLIKRLQQDNLDRVHELTQRTNQMNFSGNRYVRAVLQEILENPYFDTFVLDCNDRFGSYGTVGFSIVDRREPRMTDLMFSCRVQSKRVEHAFMSYILGRYNAEVKSDFFVNYRKTPRNEPAGKVFDDFGFEPVSEKDGMLSLRFAKNQTVPQDGIVEIICE
jgi:FkbH-like protein